jgi:predicted  nucleic acid-binding Zn-ribbon protein
MSKIAELDKLRRAISDAEIRLYSVKANVEQMDKEISILSPRKIELEQNIDFLKMENTIPIVQEYRKAKAELVKTTSRLKILSFERAKANQAYLDIVEIIDKFKRDYAKLVISNENNILKINFGTNNGKK